jgi:hypothetical protein
VRFPQERMLLFLVVVVVYHIRTRSGTNCANWSSQTQHV